VRRVPSPLVDACVVNPTSVTGGKDSTGGNPRVNNSVKMCVFNPKHILKVCYNKRWKNHDWAISTTKFDSRPYSLFGLWAGFEGWPDFIGSHSPLSCNYNSVLDIAVFPLPLKLGWRKGSNPAELCMWTITEPDVNPHLLIKMPLITRFQRTSTFYPPPNKL